MGKPTKREEALKRLREAAEAGVKQVSPMSRMERDLEDRFRKQGQAEMDAQLAALPPEDSRPKACPRCGRKARVRATAVARTFQSLWGTHTVFRNYHYCEHCRDGFYPRDRFLGLPEEGALTEEVEARVADFAVNDSYQEAEARWRVHYRHFPVSANQFRQVAKRLGRQAEQAEAHLLQCALLSPEEAPAEKLYAMSDGGMVPMRERKWNEAKLGVLFREEHLLSSQRANRGELTRGRYVGVLGGQEEFKEAMRAAFEVENGAQAGEVVWLGDGAAENWTLAEWVAPSAQQILDWYHAVENGMKCGKALLGEQDASLPNWKRRLEALLMASDFEALDVELAQCRGQCTDPTDLAALDELCRYYGNNRSRMDYAAYRQRGLLIGSGIVESGHRHVIQTRMKKAGQHWGPRGGRQMARMRAAYRTAGPERFYASVCWAYRQTERTRSLLRRRPKVDLRRTAFGNR